MEFKFSYATQKANREQFQQMAKIIEQYRAGFGEDGLPLHADYKWTKEDREDPRDAEDLPLQARLQVDRNTEATYQSSWEKRSAVERVLPVKVARKDLRITRKATEHYELVLLELHTHFDYPELL